jgi:hypothetical protein
VRGGRCLGDFRKLSPHLCAGSGPKVADHGTRAARGFPGPTLISGPFSGPGPAPVPFCSARFTARPLRWRKGPVYIFNTIFVARKLVSRPSATRPSKQTAYKWFCRESRPFPYRWHGQCQIQKIFVFLWCQTNCQYGNANKLPTGGVMDEPNAFMPYGRCGHR